MVVKLFNVELTGDQVPIYRLVQRELMNAKSGRTDQFLYNFDYYLAFLPEVRASMAERGRRTILTLAQEGNWKGNRNDLVDELEDNYLALFQALEDYVVVGIDMEKEGYPSALYTRSRATLNWLFNQGCISESVKMDRVMSALTGNKTALSLKERNFVTVRLDLEEVVSGKPIFKLVVPQSNLDIGMGKRYVIIPAPFMYIFESMVQHFFKEQPFKFVKSTVIGPVTHVATIYPHILQEAYRGKDEELIRSKLNKIKPGYDILKQRFYAYDLEASLTSAGVASFRPEMLDSIVPIPYSEIDTSHHTVNFDLLRGIFKTRINNAKTEQLESLGLLDLSGFANLRDKQQAIIEAGDRESDKALYWLMRNNPDVFGDIEESLKKRERVMPRFLKYFQPVELPEKGEDRVELFNNLLKQGVVKFTAQKKDGGVFERTGTNNPQVLERVYGKDYIAKYESIRNRLYAVLDLLRSGEVKTIADLERIGVEYNFLDRVDHAQYFDARILQGDISSAENAILSVIEELKARASTRRVNPYAVTYRDLNAEDEKGFFGNFNVNTVISAEFSKIE